MGWILGGRADAGNHLPTLEGWSLQTQGWAFSQVIALCPLTPWPLWRASWWLWDQCVPGARWPSQERSTGAAPPVEWLPLTGTPPLRLQNYPPWAWVERPNRWVWPWSKLKGTKCFPTALSDFCIWRRRFCLLLDYNSLKSKVLTEQDTLLARKEILPRNNLKGIILIIGSAKRKQWKVGGWEIRGTWT